MIVITTPTGRIGRLVVDDLLARGEPVRVIARDASRLDPGVREMVEVVEGSHDDDRALAAACRGAGALLWVVPPHPTSDDLDATHRRFGQAAARAISDHAIPRVVVVSSLGREGEPAGLLSSALVMDAEIRATGNGVRVLRMPFYMENLLGQAARIAEQHQFSLANDPDRPLLTVAVRDIAEQASALLCDHTWTGQDEIGVLSVDRLSPAEMARVMTEELGHQVTVERADPDGFARMLTDSGTSGAWACAMVEMIAAQDHGFYDSPALEHATPAPTDFHTWCREVLAPTLR